MPENVVKLPKRVESTYQIEVSVGRNGECLGIQCLDSHGVGAAHSGRHFRHIAWLAAQGGDDPLVGMVQIHKSGMVVVITRPECATVDLDSVLAKAKEMLDDNACEGEFTHA